MGGREGGREGRGGEGREGERDKEKKGWGIKSLLLYPYLLQSLN